jgi:hypothetical protein
LLRGGRPAWNPGIEAGDRPRASRSSLGRSARINQYRTIVDVVLEDERFAPP